MVKVNPNRVLLILGLLLAIGVGLSVVLWIKNSDNRKLRKELREMEAVVSELNILNDSLNTRIEDYQDTVFKYSVLLTEQKQRNEEQKKEFDKAVSRINGKISFLTREYKKERQELIDKINLIRFE